MYRHYKVNRMTSKARRVVSDLFRLFIAEPECLPTEWREDREPEEARSVRRKKTRAVVADYIARHDRSFALADERSPHVRHAVAKLMNLFQPVRQRPARRREMSLLPARALPARSRYFQGDGASRRARRRMATSRPMRRWCWRKPAGRQAARRWPNCWPQRLRGLAGRDRRRGGRARVRQSAPVGQHSGTRASAKSWRRASPMATRASAPAAGECRVCLGQPDRAAARRAMRRGAVFGDALASLLEKAGYTRHPRVLHQRCRRAGRRARRARPICATARRWARTVGRSRRASIRGDYLMPMSARRSRSATARRWLDEPEAEWLPTVRDFAIAQMMALIREDLAMLGVASRGLQLRARAGRQPAASRRRSALLDERGPDLRGRAGAAEGQDARGLGAAPADAVPRHPVRRRRRPSAEEVGRQLDLFRPRHRLSLRQVPARLPDADRRAGAPTTAATSSGCRRRSTAHHRRRRRRSTSSSASSSASAERRAGQDVQARRHLRHACATWSSRSARDVVRFIMLTRKNDAPLDFDFDKVTEQSQGQPGLLRPVRPCPLPLGAAPRAAADAGVAVWRRSAGGAAVLPRLSDAGGA